MLMHKRFWQAAVAGGVVTALLYFLLVYLRSEVRAAFWPALADLLTSWRGVEVIVTFCALSAGALFGAERLRHTFGWQPRLAGCTAGAAAGFVYGLWLLTATGAADAATALVGMMWFVVPFAAGGSVIAAWYARAA